MFKKSQSIFTIVLLVLVFAVAGCKSKYEKLKASNENTKKYQEGIKLYNKKQYSKAVGLFETLLTHYRGVDGAEELYYHNAMANYFLKDYTLAAYHFNEFAKSFPSSPHAEECRFLTAYCYYLDTPIFSLDQSNTSKCVDAFQLFINLYPKSDKVPEASKYMQELHERLEQKAYANAKLYLTIGSYQSAVIAFGNALRDYPDTKYAEEMEYLSIKAQYEYAHQSREDKQQARYEEAITMADQFAEKFPSSKYLHDAQSVKKDSQNGVQAAKRYLADLATNEKYIRKLAKRDTVNIPTKPEQPELNKKIP